MENQIDRNAEHVTKLNQDCSKIELFIASNGQYILCPCPYADILMMELKNRGYSVSRIGTNAWNNDSYLVTRSISIKEEPHDPDCPATDGFSCSCK